MEFKLNDRKGSKQLSDRIIDSGEEVFKAFLSDDYVQKFLMDGQLSAQNKAIAHRRIKDFADNHPVFRQLFQSMATLTDIEEEKQFIDTFLNENTEIIDIFNRKLEELVGKPDPKLMVGPTTLPAYGHKSMWLYYLGGKESFLSMAVMVLGPYLMIARLQAYLQNNPNYKPSELTKMFAHLDFDLKVFSDYLRAMIDRRGDQVSEEEVLHLSDIFSRSVAYERALNNHEYTGANWFDG